MLEADAFTPAILVMAVLALFPLLTLVNVIRSMTVDAPRRQFLGIGITPVAGCATNILMFPV